MNAEPHILRLVLGQSVAEVEAASSWQFLPAEVADFQPFMFSDPTVLDYAAPERGFQLPPGLTCGFGSILGRVTHAFATPHLRYVSRGEAQGLCRDVIALIDAAGWHRDERAFPALEELPTLLSLHPGVMAGKWRIGDDVITLVVSCLRRAAETPEIMPAEEVYDRHTVEVRINNERIAGRMQTELANKMKRRN